MNGARPNPPSSSPSGQQPRPAQGHLEHVQHAQHAPHAPHAAPHHPQQHGGPPKIAPVPVQHAPAAELDPIELIDEPVEEAAPSEKKIQYLGVADGVHRTHKWKRTPAVTGSGVCRVRSFHGKYSEQGLEFLDGAINEWLDNNPDVEIKFVTSTVMTFEGKIREPALVLNCWY